MGKVRYTRSRRPPTTAKVREAVQDSHGDIAGLDEIEGEALSQIEGLRVIARYASSVSELTIDLMLAAAQGVPQAHPRVQNDERPRYICISPSGKPIGIFGLGSHQPGVRQAVELVVHTILGARSVCRRRAPSRRADDRFTSKSDGQAGNGAPYITGDAREGAPNQRSVAGLRETWDDCRELGARRVDRPWRRAFRLASDGSGSKHVRERAFRCPRSEDSTSPGGDITSLRRAYERRRGGDWLRSASRLCGGAQGLKASTPIYCDVRDRL